MVSEKKPLLSSEDTEEDQILNISLRPGQIEEFIGQKEVIENLQVALKAARKRKEPVEHILFSGPPGLGKTSLAHIIAHETESRITSTSGPAISRPGDLIGILTNLGAADIFFIDEIHRLPKVVEEFLYPAMESFQIDFVIDKGPYAKTIKFNLKHFTLIGATTRAGLLTTALRERFGIFHHLHFYEVEEISQIVRRSCKILKLTADEGGIYEIARRSRGTPRVANRLLRRVRDYAEVKEKGKITQSVAEKALSALGVDEVGLDDVDRRVLRAIIDFYDGGPVGLESLSATLNEETDTLLDVVEPYLLKIGYLKRTPRGREATRLAYGHFQKAYPKEPQKELFQKS
ncbi:MAG: Holliday junction branch migration DNA helicase RuvB [Candidatus Omnitrophica bacterium]|nr:Holliday junction branch migration DNA helicase RuvB [Candidatus Omnitrophota bacterium]